MSKALEMIKYAKEDNASKFGDTFNDQMNERAANIIATKRENIFKKVAE
jgi:hypothetical protein